MAKKGQKSSLHSAKGSRLPYPPTKVDIFALYEKYYKPGSKSYKILQSIASCSPVLFKCDKHHRVLDCSFLIYESYLCSMISASLLAVHLALAVTASILHPATGIIGQILREEGLFATPVCELVNWCGYNVGANRTSRLLLFPIERWYQSLSRSNTNCSPTALPKSGDLTAENHRLGNL